MPEHASGSRRPRQVLVLDDVPVNREALAEVLSSQCADLAISLANTTSQARALLQVREFDLIFLDLYLPDGRGDALLAELRAQADWRATRSLAIAVTAETDPQWTRALLAAGFIEVLIKPWRLNAIELIAARYLGLICESSLFDRAQSLRGVGGQVALLPKLRALFYAELSHSVPLLEQLFAQGDATGMEQLRHRLAGAAAFSGASAMTGALEQFRLTPSEITLEQVCKSAQALLAEAH